MEIGTTQHKPVVVHSSGHNGGEFVPVRPKAHAEVTPKAVPSAEKIDFREADQRRVEAIRRAIEQAKTLFAVSDTSFTIFKDASGQYITRFTSLRDGSVTYFPEPELVKHLESAGIDTSFIHLNA